MKRESASITPRPVTEGTSWAKPAMWALVALAMIAALALPGTSSSPPTESADAGAVRFLGEPDQDGAVDSDEHFADGEVDSDEEFEDGEVDGDEEVDDEGTVLAPVQDAETLLGDRRSGRKITPIDAEPGTWFTGTGEGIDVALIDTGVSLVEGLDQPGQVLFGPDLSNEGAFDNLANLDTYGHGTHMAGIIVGNDGTDGDFRGIAPDARLISLKVAGATGETHVAQIIAAIDWVVEHRNADGLNIRVLNLSLGLPGVKTHIGDHLSAAVERAWDAGIVVVVAGGNQGNDSHGLDSPAISPLVIATAGLAGEHAKDGIASWSSAGNGVRDPDLAATGSSIVSLRVPGSTLDMLYPQARVAGRFFRASGTSQAAATMSGTVARLLSTEPRLTPDQVKLLMMKTAEDVQYGLTLDGYGKPQLDYAAFLSRRMVDYPMSQRHERAIPGSSKMENWSGGSWNGAVWTGGTWSGAEWSATWSATWSAATWSGAVWTGATWSSATWSATWSGAVWTGARWHGLDKVQPAVANNDRSKND